MKIVALAAILCACSGVALADLFVPSIPLPPETWVMSYKDAACRGKANGLYCGTGESRQTRFQCMGGEIAFQHSCSGGCQERTLQCRQNAAVQNTAVKTIDTVRTQLASPHDVRTAIDVAAR